MSLQQHQLDHAQCIALAAEMLGQPVRAVVMDWTMESALERRAKLELRKGFGAEEAIMRFRSGRVGCHMARGAELYRLETPGGPIRLVKVAAPRYQSTTAEVYEFWAVAREDYRRLYGALRRAVRRRQRHHPPLLPEGLQQRLWANTIGFLKQTQHQLREYGVAVKRGVLLLGEPGNGKTMACRWLRWHCNRLGFEWRNVTAEEYETDRNAGKAHELFELSRPGLVFFDDVDMALRERRPGMDTLDASTFLSGMDGLDLNHGVVYIFTSNATLAQLDSAFLRPGRIDLSLSFERPNAVLRRRFMAEHWHADIVAAIDLEAAVAQTEGLSFAELDEIKRQMVLEYMNHQRWSWPHAWEEFQRGRGVGSQRPAIGFQTAATAGTVTHAAVGTAS